MTETQALTLSALAALALGGLALALGLATGSGAILLDGAYNLCFFAAALLALRVAQLLKRPDDARYPFGYLAFEPLINLVKGLLILGVAGFALIDAGASLARGGAPLAAGLALAYAAVATLACGAIVLALRRAQRRAPSPLIAGDIENWTVNFAISAGLCLAFVIALALERGGRQAAAQLVDPILVGLVVLLTLPVPLRMAHRAVQGLINRAAEPEVIASIEAAVRGALDGLEPRALYLRVLRPGRTTYALVHVLVEADDAGLDLRRADAIRRAAVDAVARTHDPVILDLVFTTVEAFAAPTTGMASAERTRAP